MKYKRVECSVRDLSGPWSKDYKSDSNGSSPSTEGERR